MKVDLVPIDSIVGYARNPRRNEKAIPKVKSSLKEYGFRQPIVVDADGVIVVGHTRWMAAKELGMPEVPSHVADNLTPAQIKRLDGLAKSQANAAAAYRAEVLTVMADGASFSEVSKATGLSTNTLQRWKREASQ